jgi:hypothetical protein
MRFSAKQFLLASALLIGTLFSLFCSGNTVSALSGSEFNAGRIIDDAVFFNQATLSANDIQIFLNSKVPTCDTNGTKLYSGNTTRASYGTSRGYPPPYTCLRDASQAIPTQPGDAYCNGTVSGGTKTAAQIIYDVSQACGVNTQVLLVLLQKEQIFITDDWPWSIQYTKATGFGCPDTALPSDVDANQNGCYDEYEGFFKQVYNAARQYQRYARQPQYYNFRGGAISYIQYNPNAACGGGNVAIQNQATAGLYNYTPYQPNAAALANLYGTGDGCSAYGNRNFWRLFVDWFGSTQISTPYAWVPLSDTTYADPARTVAYSPSPTLSISPGGTAYVTFKVRNNGYQLWLRSEAYLGTANPKDRPSIFADNSWTNNARVALQEDSVAPGGTGTFMFDFKAPLTTGSHTECFNLVVEGKSWMNGSNYCYNVDVVASQDSNNQNTTLTPGQVIDTDSYLMSPSTHTVLSMQSDGNLVLYSDSMPAWHTNTGGTRANHLIMQTDGNLVLYDPSNIPLWFSGTSGNANSRAVLQSDGNLVVYNSGGAPVWSSGTNHIPSFSNTVLHALGGGVLLPLQSLQWADRSHKLVMQSDGNLVLYANGQPAWTSFTQGNPGAKAVMQSDGNLVIYNKNQQPVWATFTHNNPGSRIVLQDDGNIVIYNAGNVPVWQSYTRGR